MKSEGKIRVFVRSRRVPVGTVLHTEPVYSANGAMVGSRSNRLILYGTTLDEDQRQAIEEGEKLSQSLGIDFEIVDSSKLGMFQRLVSSLGPPRSTRPTVVIPPLTAESEECLPENLDLAHT